MTPDEAIETAQQAILTKTGVLLKDLPLMILRDSLADKTYVEMQDKGYELPTIKEGGAKLWQLLSDALGEKVSKSSFKGALERRLISSRDDSGRIPNNVPYAGATTLFGRTKELERLREQLECEERIAICAGMGGIGKTELAIQYATERLNSYPGGICWLTARTSDNEASDVGLQIVRFAESRLGLSLPDKKLELIDRVAFCWQNWVSGSVLVVIDDVTSYEKIQPYLPPIKSHFKVLITTRLQIGTEKERFVLDVLDEEFSIDILRSIVGEERITQELKAAQNLCQWLGNLPLGIELIARYLERKKDLSIADVQKRLEDKRLNQDFFDRSVEMTAQLGLMAAFELSWQELDPSAQNLACFLSLFALAPISWNLVEQSFEHQELESIENSRDDRLLRLHLIQRIGYRTYKLHELIREFYLEKIIALNSEEDLKHKICRTIVNTAKSIPDPIGFTRTLIDELAPNIPHIPEVLANLKDFLEAGDLPALFQGLGRFYEGQGDLNQAEIWYQQGVSTTRTHFGSDTTLATSLSNLASLYVIQGRYKEAEPLYLESIDLFRKSGVNLELAYDLRNLAHLYTLQGRYDKAEPIAVQALDAFREILGDEHLDLALILNSLGEIYRRQERYSKAEPCYVEALKIRETILGNNDTRVATSCNNLAELYWEQNRLDEAEPLYLRAIDLYKVLLGEDHAYVAAGMGNLAKLYCSQDRDKEAEPLYLNSLKIFKERLGDRHPHVGTCLDYLAKLYVSQTRYEDAELLYIEAISIFKERFGETNSKTLRAMESLQELNKLQEST
jgi:tetratricopeptide (TPR) repeat protein